MKKDLLRILLLIFGFMYCFMLPKSSQAKVQNIQLHNEDGWTDWRLVYQHSEFVPQEDLFFPGDSGQIILEKSWYDSDMAIVRTQFVSSDPAIVTVDSEGNYRILKDGFAYIDVKGYDAEDEVVFDAGYSFLVGGDMTETTLSKSNTKAYVYEQNYDNYRTDEIEIPLVHAPDLTYCSFEMMDISNPGMWIRYRFDKAKKALVLTAAFEGKTKLTFQINGKQFEVNLTVTRVSISKESSLLDYKGKTKLKIRGCSGKVKWVSNNKKIVTVSKKGLIKAKKRTGNTLVYAQIGEHRLGCAVSVVSPQLKKVVNRAKKIATTCKYSQAKRMNRDYYDCSSLVWRAYRPMGKTFGSKNYAPVAANIAQWSVKKKKKIKGGISNKNINKMKLRPGDLMFGTGAKNGRYKGVYHVEMFVGYRCYGFQGKTPLLTTCWAARFNGYGTGAKLAVRP